MTTDPTRRRTVGRERELRVLADVLDGGRGGFLALEGEGGAGKTHLLDVAASLAAERGRAVAWGRATDGPGTPAAWPWTQVLRGFGLPRPSAEDPFERAEEIADRLAGHAGERPLLVLLDDLHLADDATLRILELVAPELRRVPVALIAAWRPSARLDRIARLSDRHPVGPLPPDAIAVLAGPGADVARLGALTGGNAFLLHEVLRAEAAGAPPRSAERLVAERLDAAPTDAVDAAMTVALAGELPDAAVRARPDAFDGLDGLDAARRAGLVVAVGDVWRPVHDLLAEALRARLPSSVRRERHAALARALAPLGGRHRVAAAEHALAAGAPDAVALALEVAAAARAERAWATAARLLEAVAARPDLPDDVRADVWHDLAEARLHDGHPGGKDACREALTLARRAGDAERFARAAVTWGVVAQEGVVDAVHVEILREALALAPPDRPLRRARVAARLAGALQPAADPTEAIALAEEAIALARAHGGPRDRLDVLHDARRALRVAEPYALRVAIDRECIALVDELRDETLRPIVVRRLLFDAWEAGERAEADRHLQEHARLLSSAGTPRARATLARLEACARTLDGDFAGARAAWESVASRSWPPEVAAPIAFQGFWLAWWWQAGDLLERFLALPMPPGVEADLAKLVAASRIGRASPGDLAALPARLGRLAAGRRGFVARLALATGDRTLARLAYDSLLPDAVTGGVWPGWFGVDGSHARVLGELAAILGDDEAARDHIVAGLAFDRRLGSPLFVGIGEAALARLLAGSGSWRTEPATSAGKSSAPSATSAGTSSAPSSRGPTVLRDGETFVVTASGRSVRLGDSDGLRYLAHLLARPGVDVPALDLVALSRGAGRRDADAVGDAGDAGAVADPQALAAWRKRLQALRDRIEDAEETGDVALAERLHDEMLALARHAGAATGLGGGARRAGSPAERARVNVTQRIKRALERVSEVDRVVGHALAACVRTGTTCRYDPPP